MVTTVASDNDSIIQRFTKIFYSKDKQDDVNDSIKEEDLQEIGGRVTRSSEEAHFEYLQKDIDAKKFGWVMGGDGLILFLKQSNIHAIRSIGFEDRWIRKKLEDGEHLRLGIFYRSDQCVPATWDGILSLVDKHYPKSISSKILQYENGLKTMSFDEIEDRAQLSYLQGASYFDFDELSINGYSTDPRFMSEERFVECEGTLEESRGFLYNRLGLSRLFDGSGFSKHSGSQLCVREYLQPNVPVRNLPGFRYLDLTVDTADLIPNAKL